MHILLRILVVDLVVGLLMGRRGAGLVKQALLTMAIVAGLAAYGVWTLAAALGDPEPDQAAVVRHHDPAAEFAAVLDGR